MEPLKTGGTRIWFNEWAATIRKDSKIYFNHLHNLQYYACRGRGVPRCRCGTEVPKELVFISNLERIGLGGE